MAAALVFSAIWGISASASEFTGKFGFFAVYGFADTLRYGAWCAFLLSLIWPTDASTPRPITLTTVTAALISASCVLQLLGFSGLNPTGEFARVLLLLSLALVVVALSLLEQLWRNLLDENLWRVKPLCLGLGAAFAFDFYMFAEAALFGRIDRDVMSVRGLVYAMVIPLLALAAMRGKGWIENLRFSRKMAFHSAALLLAGLYMLFLSGVGYYVRVFGGDWGRALQLALLFAGALTLALLAFSGSMRATVRLLLSKNFFRYRYDYREEWLRFTRLLSEQGAPEAVGQRVIRALADMVESPAGALWLLNSKREGYIQSARWNMPEVDAIEDYNSTLCSFVAERAGILNIEEHRSRPEKHNHLALPDWLSEIPHAWLLLPLVSGTEMTGFVVLASPRTANEVDWEVNDLMRTASRQAASFLAQVRATEELLEARKFEAFNRMSAFVVHDLKNIVAQLSLMMRNAERHSAKPEFQQDMLMTVKHSVERMHKLTLQLQLGAQDAEFVSGVDLRLLVHRIATAKISLGVPLETGLGEHVIVKAHEDRLERVIGNIVQNGLDAAVPCGGSVRVSLQATSAGEAVIEVKDSGEGMDPDFLRERLFKPFQTTKPAGMGVGAYESAQYIRELGGRIEVKSQLGVGTTVTIFLPLFAKTGSDSPGRLEPA